MRLHESIWIQLRGLPDFYSEYGSKWRRRHELQWESTRRWPYFPKRHQPLFNYFKQLFAQVTNPPIDAIREEIVTSKTIYARSRGQPAGRESRRTVRCCSIDNPILTNTDHAEDQKYEGRRLQGSRGSDYLSIKIPDWKRRSITCISRSTSAYRDGANILILSDRGVDEIHVPIPSLLAVSAVHQHLVTHEETYFSGSDSGIRRTAGGSSLCDTARIWRQCRESISGICDTIHQLIEQWHAGKGLLCGSSSDYNKAIIDGIVKIASKMGISTIQSYQGSQIFEAIGISAVKSLISTLRIRSAALAVLPIEDIENDVDTRHTKAFDPLGLKDGSDAGQPGLA